MGYWEGDLPCSKLRDAGQSGGRAGCRDDSLPLAFHDEGAAEGLPPASTVTGMLSPVSVEVSMLKVWASTTLRSAEMRSPELRRTTSPTTSSLASISTDLPSRITVALRGSRSRSRCAARSALYSWAKANRPFIKMTAKMATPSSGILATNARIPAPQSRSAKKWTICPARRRQAGGGGVTGRALGPSRSRRAAASAVLRLSRVPEEASGAGTSPGFIDIPPGCQSLSSFAPLG